MPVERARPIFGAPQAKYVELSSFPDAKLRKIPLTDKLKDGVRNKYVIAGIYNGSIIPSSQLLVPEEEWNKLPQQLERETVRGDDGTLQVKKDSFKLPEWAVIKASEVKFGLNQGNLPSSALVLKEVDISLSGNLQAPLESL